MRFLRICNKYMVSRSVTLIINHVRIQTGVGAGGPDPLKITDSIGYQRI